MNAMMVKNDEYARHVNALDAFFKGMFDPFDDFMPELMHGSMKISRIDFEDTKDCVLARIPVPGFNPADIEVEVVGDFLTVRAKHENVCKPDLSKHFLRRERSWGEYEETVRIPGKVKGQDTTASCKDGVLTITMPKESEKNGKHTVTVK